MKTKIGLSRGKREGKFDRQYYYLLFENHQILEFDRCKISFNYCFLSSSREYLAYTLEIVVIFDSKKFFITH